MKYGYLVYDRKNKGSVNLGDDIQLIAVERLYDIMQIPQNERVKILFTELSSYNGEYVILPFSFPLYGYREGLNVTVFSHKIIPVFLGISMMTERLSQEEVMYLKKYEPIGCRDVYTMKSMIKNGIDAYTNGCLTTMFTKEAFLESEKKEKQILIVDVNEELMRVIPSDILGKARIISQIKENCDDPRADAFMLLKEYAETASLIITTRLHCALPCLAMGIPVIVLKDKYSFRFPTLSKYVHIYEEGEYDKIGWNPEPIDITPYRNLVISNAQKKIKDARDKYLIQCSISEMYEKESEFHDEWIEHVDNVKHFIRSHVSKKSTFSYAIWGVTQKADLICDFLESEYPLSRLDYVYDKNKEIIFHGVKSQDCLDDLLKENMFVFVATASANLAAIKLFKENNKKDFYISTDGVGEEERQLFEATFR